MVMPGRLARGKRGSVAFGVLQISADSQSVLAPGNNTASADGHNRTSGVPPQPASVAGLAEMSDNMTSHVISLEHLAHDLQQHLAGESAMYHTAY